MDWGVKFRNLIVLLLVVQVSKRFGRSSKVLDNHEVDSVTLVYFKNDLDKKDRKVSCP